MCQDLRCLLPITFGLGLFLGRFLPNLQQPLPRPPNSLEGQRTTPQPQELANLSRPVAVALESSTSRRPTQLRVEGEFLKRDSRKPFMELPLEVDCDPLEHILVVDWGQRERWNLELARLGLQGATFWPVEVGEDLSRVQALSHRRIYEEVVRQKWACATILEGNVTFRDDFKTRLMAITATNSMAPFDVIFWGWCGGERVAEKKYRSTKPELTYGLPGPCLFAYTVSLQGAFILSQANTPLRFKADEVLRGPWDVKLRARVARGPKALMGSYWHVVPMMAFLDSSDST